MKYNSIGEQLIAKAKEIDPSYKSDKFNDMSEALDIILNNSGGESTIIDIQPYLNEDFTKITQEGFDLIKNNYINGKHIIITCSMDGATAYLDLIAVVTVENELLSFYFSFDNTSVTIDNSLNLTFKYNGKLSPTNSFTNINGESYLCSVHDEETNRDYTILPDIPIDDPRKAYALNLVNNTLTWNTIGDGLTIENGTLKTTTPPLPTDASTKTYTLQTVNGVLTWTDAIGDINTILDNINGEVI